jgi:hypothetical protein
VRSGEYQIDRFTLARISVTEYVRQFWWYIAIVPLFGLVAVIFGFGPLRVIGITAMLWPLTIPGRAVLSTGKAAKLFRAGTYATWDETAIYFHAANGGGMKLEWMAVRAVVLSGAFLVFRTRRLGFVPIPLAALSDTQIEQLRNGPTSTRSQLSSDNPI